MTALEKICLNIVDCEHKTAPTQESGIPSVRTTDIKRGFIDFIGANKVSTNTYKVWTQRLEPKPYDLILAREAPVGEVGIIPEGQKTCLGQRTVLIRPDPDKVYPHYLLYLMLSREVQHEMRIRAAGSTVEHLNMSDIRELKLPKLPSLEVQQQIGNTLANLDRKIENLRRQNETLEAIAQTLFKHWFVDFEFPNADGKPYKSSGGAMEPSELGEIPAGWRVGKLGDIATFKNGKSPPEKSEDFKIPIYGSNGVIGYAKVANNHKTVIIGRVGSYCGSLFYYIDQCWVTDNAMTGSLKNYASHAYLYFFLASSRLNKLSGGSGQPLLNQTILSSIELSLPDKKLIQKFEDLVNPLFRKIFLNQNNVETLTKTRDVLLPKLMSGKLRIT